MTKLTVFLTKLAIFLGFWAMSVLYLKDIPCYSYVFLPLPFYALVVFGIYSASVVLYRTLTFNDCPEAAKELMEQIGEARKDLKRQGMKSL